MYILQDGIRDYGGCRIPRDLTVNKRDAVPSATAYRRIF